MPVDLNLITKSDPLRISTEPLNGHGNEGTELSLSTSFDSMDDSKSKSTDVSMEDALCAKDDQDEDEIEDLPTPPATPPVEERLKSPVSTTSRSPPSPTEAMTPTRKVYFLQYCKAWKIDSRVKKCVCEMKWSFTINRLCRWHPSGKSMKTSPVAANSTWTLQRKKGRGNHRENHVQARVSDEHSFFSSYFFLIDHHFFS